MKKKTLFTFLIIIIGALVSTVCFAIYKTACNLQAVGNMGDIIIELENKSAGVSTTLKNAEEKITYLFDVKNYKVQDALTYINEVKANYFVKISGLDENKFNIKLYSLSGDNEETLLYKSTKYEFTDYYETNKILNIKTQEVHSYKLEISLKVLPNYAETANVVIDLGYIQYQENNDEPNTPELVDSMIPIAWDGAQWVKADVTNANNTWYDYNSRKWANVATVKENGINTRTFYKNANSGVPINSSDIETMWVWIPRFVYKINETYAHRTISANDIASGDYLVDIHFSKNQQDGGDYWDSKIVVNNGTNVADSIGKWTTHPAFTFGDRQLNGFWVAKFKAGCSVNNATAITNIYSKSGCFIYKGILFDNMVRAVRNMETQSNYGWGIASNLQSNGTFETDENNIDIHLFKNSEWGAVAFLSQSLYGVGANELQVWYSDRYAGGNLFNDAYLLNCNNSSTLNPYGVYDLNHKIFENVAGYVGSKGNFSAALFATMDSKYIDEYAVEGTDYNSQESVYNMFQNFKGAAIWEVSATGNSTYSTWYAGRSNIAYLKENTAGNRVVLITRGGESGKSTGNLYSFGNGDENDVGKVRGFRPVLIVGEGL